MSNVWMSWFNWVDAESAILSADAEAGELVVENLRERQGYKVWRTDGLEEGATDAGFDIDFGQARTVQVLALVFPRENDPALYDEPVSFASDDTIRHRLSAVSAGAGELFDSGVVESGVADGYGYHVVKLDAPVSARYWRVDIDAISRAALSFVDVARAWAGPVFTPTIGFSFGDNYGWTSDSAISRASRGLAEFSDNIEPVRTWTLQLEGLSNTERNELIDFERRMTASGQFLIGRGDVDAGMASMLARQQQSLGLSSLAHARNSKAFRLVESL